MKIKQGFKLRTVGSECIVSGEGLQQIDFNKLISLNSSAAYLWRQVEDKEFSGQTLADLLVEKYDIAPETASTDASDILRDWLTAGIIEE